MTTPLDQLQHLVEEDDTWFQAEGEYQERATLLRGRHGIDALVAHPNLSRRLVIRWDFGDDAASGMPSDAQSNEMASFENAAVPALELDMTAVLTFVFTHAGVREWTFYFSDVARVKGRINSSLANLPRFPLEMAASDDPDWTEYRSMLASLSRWRGAADDNVDNDGPR